MNLSFLTHLWREIYTISFFKAVSHVDFGGVLFGSANYFFSGRFQTLPFSRFGSTVVSLEIIWIDGFQHISNDRFDYQTDLAIGGLNFAFASFDRCWSVLWLISTPFLLNRSRCRDSLWTFLDRWICASRFYAVTRDQPERVKPVRTLDFFIYWVNISRSTPNTFRHSLQPAPWPQRRLGGEDDGILMNG